MMCRARSYICIARTALCGIANAGRREMGDVFWERMFGANATSVDGRGLAGFGECIVARIEIFTLLELFG